MKTMISMTDTSWRQPMWTSMMNRLPASITINVSTQSYAVKDNSLQYIYSDDIDEDGVDMLIDELARELILPEREAFREAFSMKTLKRAWKDGRKGYAHFSQMGSGEKSMLRTDVLFGQGGNDMVFELRFDVLNINVILPERVHGKSGHGKQ